MKSGGHEEVEDDKSGRHEEVEDVKNGDMRRWSM